MDWPLTRVLLRAKQEDRDLHQVPHAVGGGAVDRDQMNLAIAGELRRVRTDGLTLSSNRQEPLSVSATQREARRIVKEDDVFTVGGCLELVNTIQVDDRASVNLDKLLRIQTVLDPVQGPADQMGRCAHL